MRGVLLGLSLAATTLSCGARSALFELQSERRDAGAKDAAHEAAPDAAPDVVFDAPGDAVEDVGEDAPSGSCVMTSALPPIEVLATAGGVVSPSIVVAEPASASSSAKVLVSAVAPGKSQIQVGTSTIGALWPDDVEIGETLILGSDSFSYPQMARSVYGLDQLVVTWLGGPGSLQVRWAPISLPDLEVGAAQPVEVEGSTPVDLAAGQIHVSTPDGYNPVSCFAVATQFGIDGNPSAEQQTIVTLLDETGALLDALPLGEPEPPAPDPSLLWTGDAFLAASAHRSCTESDAHCASNAITVSRLYEDLEAGVLFFNLPTIIEPLDGYVPNRPTLAFDGFVYAAWFETLSDEPDAPKVARIKVLSEYGVDNVGLEAIVTTNAMPLDSNIGLTATPFGLILSWPENGDSSLGDGVLGRSRMVFYRVQHQEQWLQVVDGPVTIEMTKYRARAAPVGVALPAYDAAVFAWSGWSGEYANDTVYLGRVDCMATD